MIRRFVVSKLLWSAGAFETQGTLGLGPDTVMKSWLVTPASVASLWPSVKWVGNWTFQTCGARSVFCPWEPPKTVAVPQGTWLISCICSGSISVRTMNSGFNNCERQMRFSFQFLHLCVLIHTLIILNFNCNIILYSTVSFCCAAK